MLAWMLLTGCSMDGEGVAAEFRMLLDGPEEFDVRASSDLTRSEARGVALLVRVTFEDGGGPEPLDIEPIRGDGLDVTFEEGEQPTWRFDVPADLFPCEETCVSEHTLRFEPAFALPRDVFIAFELLAERPAQGVDAWEHLDLGVLAPEAAY